MSNPSPAPRIARRRTRAAISSAAAAAAALTLAAPAGAVVNGSHVVAVLPAASALELSGYPVGADLTVQARRGGVLIGTATGRTTADRRNPADGILNVNPDACWQGSTPQLLAGDEISVAGAGATDTMTVADIDATGLDQDPLTGDVLVHGVATDGHGNRLDAATFAAGVEARVTITGGLFSNGKNTLRAGASKVDGSVAYDDDTATTWTARFALGSGDTSKALAAKDYEGVFLVGLSELTIGRQPVGAIGAGCPPVARNAVTGFGRAAVNAANAATPLTLAGAVQTDATSVSVTVADEAGHTVTAGPVTPSNGTFTIPGVDVRGLADGTLTATPTVTIPPAQTFPGAAMTIVKDTVVPPPPNASPAAPATFGGPRDVSLFDDEPGAAIHYTLGGGAPSIASPRFGAPIRVADTTTIRAIAIDLAGNASAVATLPFTIAPAAGGPRGPVTIVQPVPFPLPLVGAAPGSLPAGRPLAIRGLSAPRRVRAAAVRRRGLRVSMRLAPGTRVVQIRVLRASGRRRGTPVATVLRFPARSGRYAVTLRDAALRRLAPGRYVLEVRAGTSRAALGTASRRALAVG